MKTIMIKKVADAICERRNANDWPCNGLDFDEEMARVAIEAMREPTEEMIVDGSINPGAWGVDRQYTIDAWQAMIDAALKIN